jgi:hypothetical protein
MPNAANTVNTSGVDLGATTPYPITEHISVKISNTAATGANTKNVNIRLMDSADNSSFTNVAQTANPILRTTDSSGYPASNVIIALPPNIKRYIRATALGEANGGDASDGTFSLEVLT